MLCPMPVIKTQDRVKQLTEGDKLTIRCTDPGVLSDIPSWCRINGHNVDSIKESDGEIVIVIEIGS
jgi:tRNA 2-thiouridine synthesizing protein A